MTGELPPLIQPQISLSEAIIILDNSTLVLKHPADTEREENLGQKCIFACLNGHVSVWDPRPSLERTIRKRRPRWPLLESFLNYFCLQRFLCIYVDIRKLKSVTRSINQCIKTIEYMHSLNMLHIQLNEKESNPPSLSRHTWNFNHNMLHHY